MESKEKTSRVSVVGRVGVAVGVGAVILAAAAYFTGLVGGHPKLEGEPASAKVESKAGPSDTVDLTEKQVASIKVEPVGERLFAVEKGAVGNIDYNQDMAVQVFTNYQGQINPEIGREIVEIAEEAGVRKPKVGNVGRDPIQIT